MTQCEASRTLVKSPPELWAECSDASSLARHLDQFGEIRITRLEPETAIAWEGEHASGTVRLEPSGWGTRVILTARAAAPEHTPSQPRPPSSTPAPEPLPPAAAVPDPPPQQITRVGLFARLRRFLAPAAVTAEPKSEPEPEPEHESDAAPAEVAPAESPPVPATRVARQPPPAKGAMDAALALALDSLGQAHHRPFSRA